MSSNNSNSNTTTNTNTNTNKMSSTAGLLSATIAIFALYMKTLSPNIAGGDSGELLAEGCILGTAHPPGYPLFTVMVHALFGFSNEELPTAYLVNISSAALTALAAFFMGKTMTEFYSTSIAAAVLAMGLFSFSPLIWQYAVTAEVFPINTFFASLIVYLVCKFSLTRSKKVALFGAFICGLALTNQHTIILFEAPLVLWMFYMLRDDFFTDETLFGRLSAAFFLGIAPYIYMPIAASVSPKPGSWGHVTTISGFLHHFLRKDYGTFQLFSGESGKKSESMLQRHGAYISDIFYHQGLYVVPILAAIYIVVEFKRSSFLFVEPKKSKSQKDSKAPKSNPNLAKKLGKVDNSKKPSEIVEVSEEAPKMSTADVEIQMTKIVVIATLLFYFFVFHSLSNLPLYDKLLFGVHQRFWMQPGVITFALAGLGFDFIFGLFSGKGDGKSSKVVSFLKLILSLAIVGAQIHKNYFISDQHDAYYFKQYASAILAPLPPNAVLLVNYDMQWTSIRYMQKCENFRNDVIAINLSMMTYKWFEHKTKLYPNITFPGKYHCSSAHVDLIRKKECFTMFAFVEENYDKLDLFLSGKLSYTDPLLNNKYEWLPFGLVSKAVQKSDLPNSVDYSALSDNLWMQVNSLLPALPNTTKYPEETWEWTIGRDYKDRVTETAAYRLELAIAHERDAYQPLVDATYWMEIVKLLEKEKIPTSVLKNNGLAHIHLVQNPLMSSVEYLEGPSNDVFNSFDQLGWPRDSAWKLWASYRFLDNWGAFLERDDARADHQYATILDMYSRAKAIIASAGKTQTQQDTKEPEVSTTVNDEIDDPKFTSTPKKKRNSKKKI